MPLLQVKKRCSVMIAVQKLETGWRPESTLPDFKSMVIFFESIAGDSNSIANFVRYISSLARRSLVVRLFRSFPATGHETQESDFNRGLKSLVLSPKKLINSFFQYADSQTWPAWSNLLSSWTELWPVFISSSCKAPAGKFDNSVKFCKNII